MCSLPLGFDGGSERNRHGERRQCARIDVGEFPGGRPVATHAVGDDDPNATRGQTLALSNLVTISDPSNVSYTSCAVKFAGHSVGGQFVINGVAQTGGHQIDVTSTDFANTVFDVGTAGGTDTLYAMLDVNGIYSGWQQFTVTAPTVQPPTLSVTSDPNATRGQAIALSNLVTISDRPMSATPSSNWRTRPAP